MAAVHDSDSTTRSEAQLSMPSLNPEALVKLGQRLRQLRNEDILIIGSGFMTHSLAVMPNPALAGHTKTFDEWAADALSRGDIDALTDYRNKGPGAEVAHPTADHFVPLLLTLGAGSKLAEPATTRINRLWFANSTRTLQVA